MNNKRSLKWILLITIVLVMGVVLLGPRPEFGKASNLHDFSNMSLLELEAQIRSQEEAIPNLRPDAQKLIVWASPQAPTRTKYVLIFFHGYTASRREFDPVLQNLAQRLKANLFLTRFAGHGFVGPDGHRGITAQAWLDDCAEAVSVGKALGEHIILVGSSTGASLALWSSTQPNWNIAGLILVSPNFGPKDPMANLLNWPWAFVLVKMVLGDYRTFPTHNERHAEAWDVTHHSDSLLPMAAVVERVRSLDPKLITVPVLVIYHPQDPAINHQITQELFKNWASNQKYLVTSQLQAPNNLHVLAGDLLSPGGNQILEDLSYEFIVQNIP